MLNSAEQEICSADESQITDHCGFFLAKIDEYEHFSANMYAQLSMKKVFITLGSGCPIV